MNVLPCEGFTDLQSLMHSGLERITAGRGL